MSETERNETGLTKHLVNDAATIAKVSLEVAASAIPIIGGPIATAISLIEVERLSRRLEALIADTSKRAAALDESKVDWDYLRSHRYEDTVMAALEAGRRTSDRTKRDLIVSILVGAATLARPRDSEPDALLDAVSQLSPRQVHLLKAIRDKHSGTFEMSELPPEFETDIQFDLKRIESAGFISEVVGAIYGYGGGRYDVTRTFDRLMGLVEASHNDSRGQI